MTYCGRNTPTPTVTPNTNMFRKDLRDTNCKYDNPDDIKIPASITTPPLYGSRSIKHNYSTDLYLLSVLTLNINFAGTFYVTYYDRILCMFEQILTDSDDKETAYDRLWNG